MFGPVINDVTTTYPDAPLIYQESGEALSYPAKFYETQKIKFPEIEPFKCSDSAEKCAQKALDVAGKQSNWKILKKTDRMFTAVTTTKWLGFKDDITVEVRQKTGEAAFVHMRSRSRVGKSDFGANASRIRKFFKALKYRVGP